MKIYIEPVLLKEEHILQLEKKYSNIVWATNLINANDAEVMIAFPETINKLNYKQYPNLKWIQFTTAGYDGFDFNRTNDLNIITTNAANVYNVQIAEDVFSKILYFDKQLKTFQNQMNIKKWKRSNPIFEICHSTVGIIGTGAIAIEIAKRLQSFGAKVIGYRRKNELPPFFDEIYTNQEGFNHLLKESDYIILAASLNNESKHIIKEEHFNLMKQTALIINIARGDMIDQEALIKALKTNKIRGAGLDVTSPEPLPADNVLWTLPNVFITPHSSNASPYTATRLVNLVSHNLELYLNKKTLQFIVSKH